MDTLYVFRLARCPVRGCPVRFRDGADRACAEHALESADADATARAELMMAAPNGVTGRTRPAGG